MKTICVKYEVARAAIRNADVILKRARFAADELPIAVAGRGLWSHATLAAWWYDSLMILEMRQWVGGRAVRLSTQVTQYPKLLDVFEIARPIREASRRAVVSEMVQLTGTPYGWVSLAACALRHLALVRFFTRQRVDDNANGHALHCSAAVARSWRLGAGRDPVPNLPDFLTEPCDLARSAMLRYRFTLIP